MLQLERIVASSSFVLNIMQLVSFRSHGTPNLSVWGSEAENILKIMRHRILNEHGTKPIKTISKTFFTHNASKRYFLQC